MEEPLNVVYMRGHRERVFGELSLMAKQLGMGIGDEPFASIYRTAAEHLFAIENLCCDGDIDPRALIGASHDDEPCLPFAASSTMIRAALDKTGPSGDLALLPYSAYVDIRALNLYGAQPAAQGMHRRRALMPANAAMAAA
jgi:hypothetical protein